ncbi:MAG: hypothetical protein HYX88_01920 [Chloroflexi bacterium]|nr:hypothetical protein [Chloroflexota bacterium]
MATGSEKRKATTAGMSFQIVPREERKAEKPRTREKELRWLEDNKVKLMELYAGQWVVVEGGKLISHGVNAAVVLKEAKEKGIHVPFISRIPHKGEGPLALKVNRV